MIHRCNQCGAECVSHTHPGPTCWGCGRPAEFVPVSATEAGDVAKSWDGLLGQSDDELKRFCEELARYAFDE